MVVQVRERGRSEPKAGISTVEGCERVQALHTQTTVAKTSGPNSLDKRPQMKHELTPSTIVYMLRMFCQHELRLKSQKREKGRLAVIRAPLQLGSKASLVHSY